MSKPSQSAPCVATARSNLHRPRRPHQVIHKTLRGSHDPNVELMLGGAVLHVFLPLEFHCALLQPWHLLIGTEVAAVCTLRHRRHCADEANANKNNCGCCSEKHVTQSRSRSSLRDLVGFKNKCRWPTVFTEQVLLLRVVTAETFFVQQYHNTTILEKEECWLAERSSQPASDYKDMVR